MAEKWYETSININSRMFKLCQHNKNKLEANTGNKNMKCTKKAFFNIF